MRVSRALLPTLAVVLSAVSLALAEPPKLVVPPDLKPVAGYVRFTPDTTAKSVVYVPLDDAYPFPSEELKDARRFVLPVAGLKDGKTYRFVAVGSLNDEQSQTPFTYTHGKAGGPPPDVPPDVPPPSDAVVYYFAVVRPDQNTKEFEAVMRLPAWGELRAKGHSVKDIPVSELAGLNIALPNTLPAVVTLRRNADGKTWTDTKQNKPLPTTDEAIRGLLR